MSKKIWIAAISAVLIVGVGVGSVIAVGSANKGDSSNQNSVTQEDHDKVKKEVWKSYTELVAEYREELKKTGNYNGSGDAAIDDSVLESDAEIKANIDFEKVLLDLLKKKNLISKSITQESLDDLETYHEFISTLCKLYNDSDISLTTEEMVRIELRLEEAYSSLFNEKIIAGDNYNEEEVLQLQKTIRDTIGLEEPDPNITHE